MRYVPNSSPATTRRMLEALGLREIEELFTSIPQSVRLGRSLGLPGPLDEASLVAHLAGLARATATVDDYVSFLGAGAYHHYLPAAIDHLLLRSEFYTCYTPYQAEISQGTLQAMYEYQSFVCLLTGMEVANSSMYDGASSFAEALLMAMRVTGKNKVVVSRAVHPQYRRVAQTYLENEHSKLVEVGYSPQGVTDLGQAAALLDSTTAALAVQTPNFFGCLEDLLPLARVAHEAGALLVVAVAEPISLGIIKPPGHLGADILAGEGQGLGIPLSFGGPYLGIFASKKEYLRSMPGRIVGQTLDAHGQAGYVLTLSTREQHIRRETATSNICTNHGLCALAATIFLSLLGQEGLRELALMNLAKTKYARERGEAMKGLRLPFFAPVFNEFVLEVEEGLDQKLDNLLKERVLAGLPLGRYYPELSRCLLVCCTEKVSASHIDRLLASLGER